MKEMLLVLLICFSVNEKKSNADTVCKDISPNYSANILNNLFGCSLTLRESSFFKTNSFFMVSQESANNCPLLGAVTEEDGGLIEFSWLFEDSCKLRLLNRIIEGETFELNDKINAISFLNELIDISGTYKNITSGKILDSLKAENAEYERNIFKSYNYSKKQNAKLIIDDILSGFLVTVKRDGFYILKILLMRKYAFNNYKIKENQYDENTLLVLEICISNNGLIHISKKEDICRIGDLL